MMRRYTQILIWLGAGLFLTGCLDIRVDEPLVDLGGGDTYQHQPVNDPAPGVPDEQLTREQLLERQLYLCQERLKELADKHRRLKDEKNRDEDRFEDKIDTLEDRIESLEDKNEELEEQNSQLRKELRRIR